MVRLPVSRKDLGVMTTNMINVTCQVIVILTKCIVYVYVSAYTYVLYVHMCVQILPVSAATKAVRGDRGKAPYELVFIATAPPLGYNTYFVRHSKLLDHMIHSVIT